MCCKCLENKAFVAISWTVGGEPKIVFKTAALDHSATHPESVFDILPQPPNGTNGRNRGQILCRFEFVEAFAVVNWRSAC
jgi:hypothetical protein